MFYKCNISVNARDLKLGCFCRITHTLYITSNWHKEEERQRKKQEFLGLLTTTWKTNTVLIQYYAKLRKHPCLFDFQSKHPLRTILSFFRSF
ncbi:hypothetical protein AOLI_G00139610 [Acnodon oligacanthus]